MGSNAGGLVHVFGGGTFLDIAPHLSLAARATGKTARALVSLFDVRHEGYEMRLHLTRQADASSDLVTPGDVAARLDAIVADPRSAIVVMSCAMVDFDGVLLRPDGSRFKPRGRIRTSDGPVRLELTPTEKVIARVRRVRKDLFLVGFKQTYGCTPDEQYLEALRVLKRASCNLVFANDQATGLHMVVTPEQARYHETTDRQEALRGLVDMTLLRHAHGTFTRSTVVDGALVAWSSPSVPSSLRTVVDHCIARGAYKPFLGSTVGHFAVKLDETHFLTSRRKADFNRLNLGGVGLVAVETQGEERVVAYGAKPSVGGQSQRIVFREHPGLDCIVHFHAPLRPGSTVVRAEQRPFECGSHECGCNTSRHLVPYGHGIWAVMLDHHGPNVCFSRHVDPLKVIAFLEANWDLAGRTDDVAFVPESYARPAAVA